MRRIVVAEIQEDHRVGIEARDEWLDGEHELHKRAGLQEQFLLEHDLRVLLDEFLVKPSGQFNRFMHENDLSAVH